MAARPLAAPAPLTRAVRTVDRWGLLAGVTGFLANVLLVVLFTTPADGVYAWTGPANDTIGVVSTLAMIPVAAGLMVMLVLAPDAPTPRLRENYLSEQVFEWAGKLGDRLQRDNAGTRQMRPGTGVSVGRAA